MKEPTSSEVAKDVPTAAAPVQDVPIAAVPTAPAPVVLNVFGRPSEYDPIRHIAETRAYLETPRSMTGKVKIPTIEGLASFLKIGRATIYTWRQTYPDFRDIIEELMTQQAAALIENGLDGTYNSTITKLMMGKHGYKEQSDITTNDKDITPENQSSANAAIAAFLTKKQDDAANTGNTSDKK